MRIFLKTEDEIELMRRVNRLVGATLSEIARNIKQGVTTFHLDKIAEEFIYDNGAIPAFKNLPDPYGNSFPASIFTSVNDVVAHGIPDSKTVLREGDIISVKCGALLDSFNGESCYTFCVGEVAPEIKKLLKTTKESLYLGIKNAVAGRHLGDVSNAVQKHCEACGYGVVRELTGHGIGRKKHEDPPVPNYGTYGSGILLKAGMCIAIEPMITMGDRTVCMMPDRWSIRTKDRMPAAHFEHTIAIQKGEADILSSFEEIEKIEGNIY